MKILFSALCILAFFFTWFNLQAQESDLQKENLKGKIKSFEEPLYTGAPDETEPWGYTRHFFNEAGNMIESQVLEAGGELVSTIVIKYDAQGRKTEAATVMYGAPANRTTHTYKGKKLYQTQQINAQGEPEYTITYTEKGNRKVSAFTLPGGTQGPVTTEVYTNGLRTSSVTTDKGRTTNAVFYTRDKNGHITAQTTEGAEAGSKTTTRFRYEFDKHQNWVKQHHLNEKGEVEKVITRTITYY